MIAYKILCSAAFAHDQWVDGSAIPAWVKSSCCGPADAHHLTPEQVHDMGDYYIVDGYNEPIRKTYANGKPNTSILPSQDGDYWIFYSESAAHWSGGMYGSKPYYENASQSGVYCFFVPMDT